MQFPARRAAALGAVLALPLSVLAVSPASARPLSVQAGGATAIALVSQSQNVASAKNDGTDSTVRLESLAGSSVSQVRFAYTAVPPQSPDGKPISDANRRFTTIATVARNDDGAFAAEYAPGTLDGEVYVRVTGLDSSGAEVSRDERLITVGGDRSVNVTAGSAKGFFTQPYPGEKHQRTTISVRGTSSTETTDADLHVGWIPGADRTKTANPQVVKDQRGGSFVVAVPIADPNDITDTDYDFTGTPDQIAVRATVGKVDDVEAFTLYEQSIAKVTAVADRSVVAAGETATVTVTVVDESGAPVVGAQVADAEAGTTEFKYTDATGRATFRQGPGTTQYYANVDDDDPKQAKDKVSAPVTVTEASGNRLVATSADGDAFDLDEVDNSPSQSIGNPPLPGSTTGDGDPTDVTVNLQDQSGAPATPATGQTLAYHWTVEPTGGGAVTRFPSSGNDTGAHEGAGKYSVKVPAGGNGTYRLFAQLSDDPVTGSGGVPFGGALRSLEAGHAEIVWSPSSPQNLPAGTRSTATGRLALPNGTALPGRALDLTFQRDTTTTNEDTTPDAGFDGPGSTITTALSVVTDSDGAFVAPLEDPAETPQLSELGDNIDAKSAGNAIGNAGASKNDHVVNFVHDPTPASLQLTETGEGVTSRAGEFTLYTARVVNSYGAGVAGQPVTLTTDRGYFSKRDGSAASPTPLSSASGAEVGSYRNDGSRVTLETGPDGRVDVFLAVGRDTGFDDDGAVRTTVAGASGVFRASDRHDWTSANPLNGGTVDISPATGDQDSAILPEAQTADRVRLDVRVTDGFGNPVAGEDVLLTDDSATGTIGESDGTADDGRIVSDLDRSGDVVLTSTSDAAQRVTASWTTETTTYTGSSSSTTTGSETLTDTYTVGWYVIDRGASSYALVPDGAATRPVGSAVTVTYRALDQKGQPVPDLFVTLTRTGPGSATGSTSGLTGQDGTVAYTFAGTDEGRATVLGTARVASASGEEVAESARSTSVTFGPDGPQAIDATLAGAHNGRKDDRLTVRTSPVAAGAVVKLFKIGKDGRRTLVDQSTVGANGVRGFRVKDGLRTATTYVAKIVRNSAVRGATTNTRTVR